MNAVIAVLSGITVIVLLRGFFLFAGRANRIRQAQAKDDAYAERWATWGDWTRLKTGR